MYNKQCTYTNSLKQTGIKQVVLQLVTTKCIPVLLYGLEVCPRTKAELHSLDFAVTRFLMKLFKTSSIAVTEKLL